MKGRRRTILAATVIGAVVVALAAAVTPLVRASDLATTTLRVAAAPPPEPAAARLPASIAPIWSAGGVPPRSRTPLAIGASDSGVVVVASSRGVTGRRLDDGAVLWSYRRGNATLCDWTRRDDLVVVAFRKSHGCRDLTALDAGTGARRWYRTAPVDATISLHAAPGLLVAADSHGLAAYDLGGGLDRWTFSQAGCTLAPPVLGALGVAVTLRCGDAAPRIELLDTSSGKDRWDRPVTGIGEDPVILAAEQAVTILSRTGAAGTGEAAGSTASATILTYDAKGHRVADTPIRLDSGGAAPAGALVRRETVVGWSGATVFAVTPTGRLLWRASGTGPVAADGSSLYVAGPGPLTQRELATGRQLRTIVRPAGPPGAEQLVYRAGATLVSISGTETTVLGAR